MVQPLALVLYERVMPGGQVVNRLEDLGYRVLAVPETGTLVEHALREKPMLVIADLAARKKGVCPLIADLRQNTETSHIPVIAIGDASDLRLEATAREAGATLVVTEAAILLHLTQFLEQALRLD